MGAGCVGAGCVDAGCEDFAGALAGAFVAGWAGLAFFAAGTCTVCEAVAACRLSPACTEQTGQAPAPWPLSTFSATAICWSLVARSARGAYACPP